MSSLLALSLLVPLVAARLLHLPLDTYAFPKYSVTFLNALPVHNETAQRWLAHGLRGGEPEFLDQPWKGGEDWMTMEIGSTDSQPLPDPPRHSLEYLKIGPKNSYLCLIPQAVNPTQPPLEDVSDSEITPVRSWSLLQPLSGTCLYHRQGWFTYSYCHNEQIRQFKELPHSHPHPPGGFKPEEDPDWEAYTLGRAPPNPGQGADLTVAEQSALATNLELAREADSRYLVQRWGDGTICDKTGRNREVEVQFHCSMTTTDSILFVKEAKMCSYVLVIHTPRLCGEPGFKSPLDSREETIIRCREIVDSTTNAHTDPSVPPEADRPYQIPRRKPVLASSAHKDDKAETSDQTEDALNIMIQRALKVLMGKELNGQAGEYQLVTDFSEDGVVLIDLPLDADLEGAGSHETLANALREAGYEIKGEKVSSNDGDKDPPKKKDEDKPVDTRIREEL